LLNIFVSANDAFHMGTFIGIIFALGLVMYVIQMLIQGYQEDEVAKHNYRRKLFAGQKKQAQKPNPVRVANKTTLLPPKSQKQDRLKLQYCEEKHFDNVDQASIVIGGQAGLEDRGYRGETLSLSEKVLVELNEGYSASTVIRNILDENYQGTTSQKKTIADLLEQFEQLNEVTEQDLWQIEQAWETIAERLEGIDQRYRNISLEILAYEKLSSRDGMFMLNGDDWREILSADIESIFAQSKGDPLGAINQSIEGIEKLLADAEGALLRIKDDRQFFKNWMLEDQAELGKHGLTDSWVISGLREVKYDLFRSNKEYLNPLKSKVSGVLDLVVDLERLHSESGDHLLNLVEEAEQKVARECGITHEVVFHNPEYEREIGVIDEILTLYHESLQQGDMDYAAKCRDKAQKQVEMIKTKIERTKVAALKGQQMHLNLSKQYELISKGLDAEINTFQVILDSTKHSIFQQDVVQYIERSEGEKYDLLDSLKSVKLSLEEGKFVAAIAGMEHIELKLESMQNTTSYLIKSRGEMLDMEQSNGDLLEAARKRYSELMLKRNRVYVGTGSDDLFTEVEESMASANELISLESNGKKQVDPRELAAKLYRIQVTLECLEDSLDEDNELYAFLKQKVSDIDDVTNKVAINLKQAASDGIEDSKLTKDLVTSLTKMLEGWPKLKDKLNDPEQDWSELRFEYDIFYHGMDSINVRLEQDLNLAEEASEKTKEVSERLHEVSGWRGENGMRVELVECSKIVHNAMRALNAGDYKQALVLATYAKNEITTELHAANKKDIDTQMKRSRIRNRTVGGRMQTTTNENSANYLVEE